MYSFDIFDTLITRRTATPEGIFLLMQENMKKGGRFDPYLTANFYELRTGAEKLAQQYAGIKGRQEITFDDIYKTLATTSCISEEQQEELKKLEVETEYKNVLGMEKNIALLKKLKGQGERVVLISDMYLKEATIRGMLCLADPVFKDIPIYVSSAYGKTKGSGKLFQVVQKQEQADYSRWVHYGDNEDADMKGAGKLGIKAVHLAPEPFKEYEQPGEGLYSQLSIGASRFIRSLGEAGAAGEVGSSLAGPILYPYVKWVLKESIRQGIDRLYFVSRDGWILWQMADLIIRIEKDPIKAFYIYGSRTAWRLPSFNGSKEDLGRVLYYSNMEEILSYDDMAKLFQLSWEELKGFLPKGLEKAKGGQRISRAQADTVGKWLQENGEFRKYLVESQMKNRSLVIRYLQQELDVSDGRFAFVELSGTGYTQLCLANIMRHFYTGDIKNFFYRLDDVQEDSQCKWIQFYPGNLKRYLLELLCRAPHGQAEGYREEGGAIVPALERFEGGQIKAYHMEEYRGSVLDYVKFMEQAYIQNQLEPAPKIGLAKKYAEVITGHPPKRIAEYFCHMPFSSGGRKNAMVEFSPAVSKKQLREIYFWNNGENARQVYHGDFLEYVLNISDEAKAYKEKCQGCRNSRFGKWLVDCRHYLCTRQRPGIDFFCPWELLRGRVVIYGAGKVGQSFVRQAKQKYARCEGLLWVDSHYRELQAAGMDVRPPEDMAGFSFERVIIAVHNAKARQEIWEGLRKMGIEGEKIYYG